MNKLTKEQSAILQELTKQFIIINKRDSVEDDFNYLNLAPFVREAQAEVIIKKNTQRLFELNAEAFNLLVINDFKKLEEDFQKVGLVTYLKQSYQDTILEVFSGKKCLCKVMCTAYRSSDDTADILPSFIFEEKYCGIYTASSLESLLKNPHVGRIIINAVKQSVK